MPVIVLWRDTPEKRELSRASPQEDLSLLILFEEKIYFLEINRILKKIPFNPTQAKQEKPLNTLSSYQKYKIDTAWH